jgi:hypothetical protein
MKSDGETIQICAIQPTMPVGLKTGSFLEKGWHFLSGKLLLNTLHLSNNHELIVLSRGKAFKQRYLANYSYATVYLPFERLCGIQFENCEKYENLTELNIKLSGKNFVFYFEQTNKNSIDFYNKLSDSIKNSFSQKLA